MMKLRRDVGAIPRISAEAEDQCAWRSRRGRCRDVDSVERVAVGRFDGEVGCPAWQRARGTHCMRRKDKWRLQRHHQKHEHDNGRERQEKPLEQFPASGCRRKRGIDDRRDAIDRIGFLDHRRIGEFDRGRFDIPA